MNLLLHKINMILNEINPGSIGLIYWYERTSHELSEREIEKLRQKNVSDALNATLMNHMYEPSKAIGDMSTVIQRGWNEANKQKAKDEARIAKEEAKKKSTSPIEYIDVSFEGAPVIKYKEN